MPQLYKMFCVLGCGWTTVTDDEQVLWGKYAVCPNCHGATDGYRVHNPDGKL
jgi:hypothetical protein